VNWPTKDEITQTLVTNMIGDGKTINDLSNQWVSKFLILGLREAIYMIMVVFKVAYDQLTTVGAKDDKLDELGYEYGVDRKQATYAIHTVTFNKSSPVSQDTPIPDDFLVTTTPIGKNPPVQFKVVGGQNKLIAAGTSSVSGVQVKCTQAGEIGNVPAGSINLIAQAGIDYVTDSLLYQSGTEKEDNDTYRARIQERKRNPERGGTPTDWEIWAESVEGVATATVFPRNRGNGTVDIMITGPDGLPSQSLIDSVQSYLDSKTPADIADGGIQVMAPTPVAIDVTLSNCLWRDGYSATNGSPILTAAINDYINVDANKDRIIRVMDLIAIAKNTYDSIDPTMQPILIDFNLEQPTANRVLVSQEMSVPGVITIS
jgi:uncharacterized phage protein gp47/JayE